MVESEEKELDFEVKEKLVDRKLTDALKRELVGVVRAGIDKWQDEDENSFEISVVSGGITNALYRVKNGDFSVIVRVYGEETEKVIDRAREKIVNKIMSDAGFGAETYCTFHGGRLEEFLEGRPLEPDEMLRDDLQRKIGDRLAEMHSIDANMPKEPSLWPTIDNWLKMAQSVKFESEAQIKLYDEINLSKLANEIEDVKAQLSSVKTPVVFAHNDLLSGNVMYDDTMSDDRQINFIDFEYGSYSLRGFDIANHFNECCGFECDWSRFPTRESQNNFFRSYLARYNNKSSEDVTQDEIDELYNEVNPYVLASHLFWGVWGVVQARYSKIDFDYLTYAHERLVGGFRGQRERFLSLL